MFKIFSICLLCFLGCDTDGDPTIGDNVEAYVYKLESFESRQYQLSGNDKARDWIYEKLVEFGYDIVEKQAFNVGDQIAHNVIAEKEGDIFRDKYIIIGAHYDSRAETNTKSDTNAPGANDNASGVAVVLELARELANIKTNYSVKFAFWDAEEVGLYGSNYYTSQMGNEDIKFYFNLDEIGGYESTGNSIVCEEDRGGVTSNNDESHTYALEIQQYMKNEGLQTKLGPIFGSDYMPFEAKGIVTFGLYEDPETPHYHKSTDFAKYVDFDFLQRVSNGVYKFILSEAE